jgi:hypothetical protein
VLILGTTEFQQLYEGFPMMFYLEAFKLEVITDGIFLVELPGGHPFFNSECSSLRVLIVGKSLNLLSLTLLFLALLVT